MLTGTRYTYYTWKKAAIARSVEFKKHIDSGSMKAIPLKSQPPINQHITSWQAKLFATPFYIPRFVLDRETYFRRKGTPVAIRDEDCAINPVLASFGMLTSASMLLKIGVVL